MAKLTAAEELDVAIRLAAKEFDARTPSRDVAQQLYESRRELIDPFAAGWVIEKLADLIRRQRAKLRPPVPQLVLGFHKLPRRTVVWNSGDRTRMADLTLAQMRRVRAEVWKRRNPAIEEWDRAIALQAKYARKRHDITWGEVLELEAEKEAGGKS